MGKRQIATLPTLNRDLTDFTRLTPQASVNGSGAISIAGMNNRYNAIFIDGAVNNDVFGLSASGTNGGQANSSPISIDAIEQFQIVLAPTMCVMVVLPVEVSMLLRAAVKTISKALYMVGHATLVGGQNTYRQP